MLGEEHAAETSPTWWPARPTRCRALATRRRRLDLDDQVDGAHVDAELEAAGRHHAGEPAALEVVLDQGALLLGHRAVVGPGDDRGGASTGPTAP